jgi:hypothetical protein
MGARTRTILSGTFKKIRVYINGIVQGRGGFNITSVKLVEWIVNFV